MRRVILFFLALLFIACGGPAPGHVTRAEFGDRWPLTVDDGTLSCQFNAVIFTREGVTYAVNGVAQQMRADRKWHDITEIWADNPDTPGLKKSLDPLLARGQQLCS